jgi:hypothetical protein
MTCSWLREIVLPTHAREALDNPHREHKIPMDGTAHKRSAVCAFAARGGSSRVAEDGGPPTRSPALVAAERLAPPQAIPAARSSAMPAELPSNGR